MTCQDCEDAQQLVLVPPRDGIAPVYYLRVDAANVGIMGCEKHVTRLIELYKRGVLAERSITE